MKILLLVLLGMSTFLMTGCETPDSSDHSTSMSSIPWNKPASWEGAGALGAMGMGTH